MHFWGFIWRPASGTYPRASLGCADAALASETETLGTDARAPASRCWSSCPRPSSTRRARAAISISPFALVFLVPVAMAALGCSGDPTTIVKDYLNQENCLDRAKFILDPEANRSALADYYKDQKNCVKSFVSLKPDGCDKLAEGDYCSIEAVFGKNDTDYYHLKKTADGLKIDWRSSAGYNPVSIAAFQAQRSKKPQLFRLWAKLTSYYNFDYDDAEKTHQSIDLRDKNRATLTGYILRTSPTASALLDVLKDGQSHPVMVELRYLPSSRDVSVVEIQRFVAERWRQQPEEVAPSAGPTDSASTTAMPQGSAAASISTCDLLSKLKLRGDPTECAKLVSCCCVGEPPDLAGKSKMANFACIAGVEELTKSTGINDCKQWREKVLELYKEDAKLGHKAQSPEACK